MFMFIDSELNVFCAKKKLLVPREFTEYKVKMLIGVNDRYKKLKG